MLRKLVSWDGALHMLRSFRRGYGPQLGQTSTLLASYSAGGHPLGNRIIASHQQVTSRHQMLP